MTFAHKIHCLEVAESRRTYLTAVRFVRAIADEIDAKFTLGAFGCNVNLTGRHVEALCIQLEVVDQRFHRLLHFRALGRRNLAIVRADRAARHLCQALLHDLGAFVHFLHADHEAVVTIRIGADGNVELHTVVHIVWLTLTEIPWNTRGTDHRAGEAPSHRIVLTHHGDIDVPLLKNAIVEDEAHGITEQFGQPRVDPVANIDEQFLGYILMYAAWAEPRAVHTRSRSPLEEIQTVFAQFEHPKVGRHGANVHDVRTDVEHVIADAGQFGEQNAQILSALRHLDVEQLLNRKNVAVFLRERAAVIEPIKIGQRLQIRLVLDQLLGAAMKQADMRIHPLDDLTVEFHHHTKNSVRRRVLRSEVDRVVGDHLVAGSRRLF